MLLDAFGAVAALAATQHGVVSTTQAALLGIPPSTVRSWVARGRLWSPAPGALVVPGVPLTWRTHLTIATFTARGRVVMSHRTAAALHGLDGCSGPLLEATTHRGGRPRLPGFTLHTTNSLTARDVVVLDGIRTTSVARTLADLGAVADATTVWRAADDALRRGANRRWVEEVLGRADRPGRTGTAVLREVLASHRRLGETDSHFETRLLEQLTRPDLPRPVPQYPVRSAAGRLLAVLDVAFPTLQVGVEAHSKRFHFGERMNVRDADREYEVAKEGWGLVFVRHDEVDRAVAGDKVAAYVRARSRPIGS